MEYLKSFEKLDLVLKYAADHQPKEVSAREFLGYLQLAYPRNFSPGDIASYLNILVKDRHFVISSPRFYKITFEGVVFLENGGYTVKRRAGYIKRQYLKVAHRSAQSQNSLFLWFLSIVGLGAAILFLVYAYNNWNWKIPF